MRFKKAVCSLLTTITVFGNATFPLLEAMGEWSFLRIGVPALIGAFVLDAKTAYARTSRNLKSPFSSSRIDVNKMGNDPTDKALADFHSFEVPFYPTSGSEQVGENHDLAQAIQQTLSDGKPSRMDHFDEFVKNHPQSRWVVAAELNHGLMLYKNGYFSRALKSFYRACVAGRAEKTSPKAIELVDRALAEAVRMNCRVGRLEVAKTLLAQLKARHPRGLAARYGEIAVQAVWVMEHRPGKAFFCGPYALKSILQFQKSKQADSEIIANAQSTKKGFSLDEVWDMSNELGMGYQMAKRSPGAKVIVPSVVNWKLNHYAALVEEKNGLIHSVDPTFGNQTWLTEKALDEESSGYFLVPEGALPQGWTAVGEEEASNVYGKGFVNGKDKNCPYCKLPKAGNGGASGGVGSDKNPSCHGMPVPDLNLFSASAMLRDTPIGYQPPLGPRVDFNLTYDGSNTVSPLTSNVGVNWNCNWIGYIAVDVTPDLLYESLVWQITGMTLYTPSGGQETIQGLGTYSKYTNSYFTGSNFSVSGGPETGYGSVNGGPFLGETGGFGLSLLPENITRTLPDGSSEVYSLQFFSAGQQAIIYVLTQLVDANGNADVLNYDQVNRLVSITDPIGQVTNFSYNDPSNPYGISQVSDPFGRTASLSYDNLGDLVSLTDEIGMTSQMTYLPAPGAGEPEIDIPYSELQYFDVVEDPDSNQPNLYAYDTGYAFLSSDAIQTLTTPYGTTQFSYGLVADGSQYVEITDPLQEQEMVTFDQNLNPPDSNASVGPQGTLGGDPYVNDRNTWFWNKKAMADAPGSASSAKIYHWLHTPEDQQSGVIESLKNPNESRIWYLYPTQTNQIIESSDDMPTTPIVATRFTNNTGTQMSQEYQFSYNQFGNATNYVDPIGRSFTYNYAPNGNDLVSVQDANGDYLARYTYNNQHEPLTYTDAAGQTWNYNYNSAGQIASVVAPMGETTQYNYDGNGYLTSVVPPQPGSTVTYTYDRVGRVATQTDAAHGTLRHAYDDLDRLTNVIYSDGTHESYAYTYLDITNYSDRENRATSYTYDADQHMISVTDPKMQMTQFGWCSCGALVSMTDPKGNKTTWTRDIEGRATSKTYPDGSTIQYHYDPNGTQLLSVQDPRNVFTQYTYDLNNELSNVNYQGLALATPNIQFNYDPILPRLTSMSDGTGSTSYSYYSFGQVGGGQVQTVQSPVGTTMANITYVYDQDGRTKSRAIDSNIESYIYANDELANVTNPLGSFTYTYDPATNNLTQISYPNGQKTTVSYYQPSNPIGAGRPQNLVNTGAGLTAGQTLSSFSYTYSQAGDVNSWTQQLDNTPADSRTYAMGYDKDSEITSATLTSGTSGFDGLTANRGVTFGYDASGNRTGEQTSTYNHTFNTNNVNQLTNITPNPIQVQGSTSQPASVFVNGAAVTEDTNNNFNTAIQPASGSSTSLNIQAIETNGTQDRQINHVMNTQPYKYDANGNLIQDEKYSYTWDAENRLIQVNFLNPQPVAKPDTVQMTYDAEGRREAITELHGSTVLTAKTFVWCIDDLCQERDVTGHTITKQFFDRGEQINGSNYYYVFDHLGSIRELVDSNGSVRANYDYDSYGRQTKLSGDLDSDFGYTGIYVEKSICLDLTLYRAYDPEKGRWLSRDPLGEGLNSNLYEMVLNDPIDLTDSLGLQPSNSAYCIALLASIEAKKAILKGKLRELNNNNNNLPYRAPGDVQNPGLSIWGHEREIQRLEAAIARDEADYAANCSDPPNCKSKDPNPDPVTILKVVGGFSAGYLIYRGIRMIPSVFFPPSVIPNALCP